MTEISEILERGTEEPVALESGATNRTYRVTLGGDEYVAPQCLAGRTDDAGCFAANDELSADDEHALLTSYFNERPPAPGSPHSA